MQLGLQVELEGCDKPLPSRSRQLPLVDEIARTFPDDEHFDELGCETGAGGQQSDPRDVNSFRGKQNPDSDQDKEDAITMGKDFGQREYFSQVTRQKSHFNRLQTAAKSRKKTANKIRGHRNFDRSPIASWFSLSIVQCFLDSCRATCGRSSTHPTCNEAGGENKGRMPASRRDKRWRRSRLSTLQMDGWVVSA